MRSIPLEEMEHVVIFGGGIIGVLNGLVAKARGTKKVTIMDVSQERLELHQKTKKVTIMDVSQERLELHQKLGLPFDNFVNSGKIDPVEWVKEYTNGCGVDAVVVAASVKQLVPPALQMLAVPVEQIDLNIIHYRELHVHGANSSVHRDYIEARNYIESGKINADALVTHKFSLEDFNKAVKVQGNPAEGAMKVLIKR